MKALLLLVFTLVVFEIPKAEASKKQDRAAKKAQKQRDRAEKACDEGKARKCERLERKAAANEYAAETGDFKGKRQMKRRDRKLRRAEGACNKGKQKKCDRLTRQANKHDCLLEGGSRKECRQEKRQMRKDQRAFRKGFSDNDVTGKTLNELTGKRDAQRDFLFGNIKDRELCQSKGGNWDLSALKCSDPNFRGENPSIPAYYLSDMGCVIENVPASQIDSVSYFKLQADCMAAFGLLEQNNCTSSGGVWNGQACESNQPRGIATGYSKASRFVPMSSNGGGSGQTRSVIKGQVQGGGAQRQINTFGNSVNNSESQSASGSLNSN